MKQKGYGKEIARIVNEIPENDVIRTEEVSRRFAEDYAIPYDKARGAVNVQLKRMADHGDIKRLWKGKYCHVRQTVFGPVMPDIDQLVIRGMTVQDGARIGYESGASLLNRTGFSTLLPQKVEITTNHYGKKLPEDCHIVLKKPATEITDDNWRYFQVMDVVKHFTDLNVDAECPGKIFQILVRKLEVDPLTLIFMAKKYFPGKVVLLLIDLLGEAEHEAAPR